MSIREELQQIKYLFGYEKGKIVSEQSVFSNLPGVQPDKMDYRKPIPDPEILPDCFSMILKSDLNMISFNKDSLSNETNKRVNNVDLIFEPNANSDKLGITIIKDGQPFCFIKK